MSANDRYIWISLKMTGRDDELNKLFDLTCVITDTDFNKVHKGINFIIHATDVDREDSSGVTHTKKTLRQLLKKGTFNLEESEIILENYIKLYGAVDENINYLAGNSTYLVRVYFAKHMPRVDNILDFRMLNVSSFFVYLSHEYPSEFNDYKSQHPNAGTSDDINQIIRELLTLKTLFLK